MSSKYIDTSSIVQVIGCVYNNPKILDYGDKYVITEDDFDNDFHRVVFGAIYKLHELGAESINLENILDFLSSRPNSEAIFTSQKGEEWLARVSQSCSLSSFDYYYNRMKKMTLLRMYDKYGVDVSDLYDPDNIFDSKKKQKQEEWLDNSSLITIANAVNDKIDLIKAKYVDNATEDSIQAGQGIQDLITKLKETPEVGVPLYGSLINTITRGARLRKFYLRSAPTGCGKAIPNYTEIPTPSGWKKVGDIKVGDFLFGQNGLPTKVLAVYPQEEEKEIWKVTLANGNVAECCGEHLWEYWYRTHRGWETRVEDTQTIYERTLTLKNGFKDSDNRGYRFKLSLNEAVQYPQKDLKLDPYIMGAFLGDGSFRYDSTNKALNFSSKDEEIPEIICHILGDSYYTTKNSNFNYNWTFRNKNNPTHPIWVEEFLKDYPELWMTKSETKFIPEIYLQGSIEQRYALLQGLMDTDGTIDIKGRIKFTTVSPKLKDNVIELCRSLGFIANYTIDKREEQYTTGECYTICIQTRKELKAKLFRLKRKIAIATQYINSDKRSEHKELVGIVNIEKTNVKTKMTCFSVDNTSHLFLMNDFIVTHNTRTMIADACYIACDKIYDENFGWIKNGICQPTLYITTEQDKEEIQTMMLAFLSNVNEEHILNGSYVEDEEERVREAGNILLNSPLYIEELPDFSLQDVENLIKKNIRDKDVRYIAHDYIHTSLKILEEIATRSGGVKLREDNVLFMLSTRLKDICNQYGVFILSSTQLNADYQLSETPDQNLLRGAKAIADKIDIGSVILPVKDNDLLKLQSILDSGVFEQPNLKLSIYKNRRGRFKGVYLWCKADLGTCRVKPIFCTGWDYTLIDIQDYRIKVLDDENDKAF